MKTEIEVQKENIQTLLKLIAENPDLRIVPMINYEIVAGDDCAYWRGKWGKSSIERIYSDDEMIYIESIDAEDLYQNFIDDMPINVVDEKTEKIAMKKVDELPWEKVIIVYIELP
jgi:hypothetical protein